MTVWLKLFKKEEVFSAVRDREKRLVLDTFFSMIDRNLQDEIVFEIVCIMDLFVKHLRNIENPPSQRKRRKILISAVVYEVFAVLGKLSSKVDSHYSDNEEINAKLFDVLLVFRKNYGTFLQSHDLK